MMRRPTRWLFALYPRWWRDRYGEEAMATLDGLRPGMRDAGSVLVGVVDAWLFQRPPRELWRYALAFRQVLESAQNEAFRLGQDHIGTEHLLLGILAQGSSRASQLLTGAGATPDAVRALIAPTGHGTGSIQVARGMTPRAKRVMERAGRDAERSGELTGSPECLLLALLEQPESRGICILLDLGVDSDLMRAALREGH